MQIASNASIRRTVCPDGFHRFSVYDFICIAGQKPTSSDYGRVTYARLVSNESEFSNEVVTSVHHLKFPGSGQRTTPTMTLRGLQRLLLILGTRGAAEFRMLLESTFTRIMAGDTSLIDEIQSNAAYKQALAQEPVVAPAARKRKVLEMLNPVWQSDASVRQDAQGEAGPGHETRGSIFSKLRSSEWPNDKPGVNQFVALGDVETYHSEWWDAVPSSLRKAFRAGNPALAYEPGAKFHAFGFHYRGYSISPKALEACEKIKEAFGVEVDGVQFVFLELFRVHGCRVSGMPIFPYKEKLLPPSVSIEQIPGCDFHLSVYKSKSNGQEPVYDDFILAIIKRPADGKWHWTHSSVKIHMGKV